MPLALTRRVFVVGVAMTALAGMPAGAPRGPAPTMRPVVRFDVPPDHPERWAIELTGYGRGRPLAPLQVYALPRREAAEGDAEGLPPLIGRYEIDGRTIRFVPRYAPARGVTYVARAPGAVTQRFTLPLPAPPRDPTSPSTPTRVLAIYPTQGRVPENLLKLYLEFSAPMCDGEAEQRLHLYDAQGRELPRAFLHVDAELWNDTHTRLTVLFDPGRIKRGLRANLEEGAPLAEGYTFRLAIDSAWRDAQGEPLAGGVERTLTVGRPDRTSPNWHRWTLDAPIAGSRAAVTLHVDEPLDHALLDRWLLVVDRAGAPVPGHHVIGPHQTRWSFEPDQPWRAGETYRLLIDPRLEDLAGNSLVSLFDAAISAQPRRDVTTPIALSFAPAAGT
jgi:hypothetical protein